MAHAAPPPPGRQRRVQILGLVVVALGIALLAITLVTLNRPKERQAARITQSGSSQPESGVTSSPPPTTSASSSAASSSAASSSAATTRTSSKPSPARTTSTPQSLTKVPLLIANNTGAVGLAATAATRFEAEGWKVSDLQNFSGDILSTCAYYDPANPANRLAALELQKEFPAIKRVKERFDELPSAPIVVMLTSDYS